VVYYTHNFRPFSVSGYLWGNDQLAEQGLKKNFLPEILHGSWQNSRLKTAWLAAIFTLMHNLRWFRCIKSWVAVSGFMKEKFITAGIAEDDIFVAPHFWEPRDTPPAPGTDQGYFVFLGRITPEKGYRVLLAAWQLLAEELGANTPRLVIGGKGPRDQEVREAAETHQWLDYVGEIYGEEKDKLLRDCCAILAPSRCYESLGLVAYEAYDYCKPIVAAASGGLTETVQHGKTGFLHTPGDARALADHVKNLWLDRSLRARFGEAGRDWLLANTSREEWLRKIMPALAHAVNR
jgi:glycosyltransferase involved in cell wall biosynthesis